MPCAATQTGLWCPLGLNVSQARNPDSNAPIQRLATMRLPWRQNTLRFLPIDAQAPGLLGHICRSISSRTHKHAGKRRAAIMNKTSADATRLTAPPALHWARDSRAHHPRRHGPTSTFEGFFFFFFGKIWIKIHPLSSGLQGFKGGLFGIHTCCIHYFIFFGRQAYYRPRLAIPSADQHICA